MKKNCLFVFVVFFILISCDGVPQSEKESVPTQQSSNPSVVDIQVICLKKTLSEGKSTAFYVLKNFSDGTKTQIEKDLYSVKILDEGIVEIEDGAKIIARKSGTASVEISFNEFKKIFSIKVVNLQHLKDLKITEVFYDAEGSDSGKEFIKITNFSENSIEISGFRIVDGNDNSRSFIFPEGTFIDSFQNIILCDDMDMFFSEYRIMPEFFDMPFALNNSGETVFLYDADSNVIESVYIEGGTEDFPYQEGEGSASAGCEAGYSIQLFIDDNSGEYFWENADPDPAKDYQYI